MVINHLLRGISLQVMAGSPEKGPSYIKENVHHLPVASIFQGIFVRFQGSTSKKSPDVKVVNELTWPRANGKSPLCFLIFLPYKLDGFYRGHYITNPNNAFLKANP